MQRFVSFFMAFFCAFFFVMLLQVSFVQAAATPVDQLTKLLKNMTSLDADFQQRILDAKGGRLQEVSGHLSLARPGKFYWRTETPFPQTVVSDGETLWLYDPDLEQVSIQTLDPNQSRTPAMLLSGDIDSIEQRFIVKLTRDSERFQEYLLVPIEQDSLFEELRLSFTGNQLSSLLLSDSLGQRTSIELYDAQFNPSLPDDRFSFAVPEDVDVILQ